MAEDNKVNQFVVLKMLKRFGFEADVAWNGKEAVEACQKKIYDLIVSLFFVFLLFFFFTKFIF